MIRRNKKLIKFNFVQISIDCIDTEKLAEMYEDVLFENGELRLSLKEIAPSSIKDMLPDKIMIFKKDDLYKLLGLNKIKHY